MNNHHDISMMHVWYLGIFAIPSLPRHKDVLRFQVSVNDSMAVEEIHSGEDLKDFDGQREDCHVGNYHDGGGFGDDDGDGDGGDDGDLPHNVLDPVRSQAGGRASLYVQVQVLKM